MFLHAVTPVESISGTCLGVLMILYSSTLDLKLNGDCIVSKMLTISLILKRIKVCPCAILAGFDITPLY